MRFPIREIMHHVCTYCDVTVEDVMRASELTSDDLAKARSLFSFIAYTAGGLTFPQIARVLGFSSHTGAIKATSRANQQVARKLIQRISKSAKEKQVMDDGMDYQSYMDLANDNAEELLKDMGGPDNEINDYYNRVWNASEDAEVGYPPADSIWSFNEPAEFLRVMRAACIGFAMIGAINKQRQGK